MPVQNLIRSLSLPEVKIVNQQTSNRYSLWLEAVKESKFEVCPKCAHPSSTIYDRRVVRVRDSPIRDKKVILYITKRRFLCKICKKPFTEPVPGIQKSHRTTQRLQRDVLYKSERFVNLKAVEKNCGVSSGYAFKATYDQLELQRKMHHQYPWPSVLGLDEHSFRRVRGYTEFASVFIDFRKHRVFELVDGKSERSLVKSLDHIPGKENVKNVVIDMCTPFKNFVINFFPNARITVDKFHVLRLISRPFSRCRREKIGHLKAKPRARFLFKPEHKLKWEEKFEIQEMIRAPENQSLKEYYNIYQALHRFYRIRGRKRAVKALNKPEFSDGIL